MLCNKCYKESVEEVRKRWRGKEKDKVKEKEKDNKKGGERKKSKG